MNILAIQLSVSSTKFATHSLYDGHRSLARVGRRRIESSSGESYSNANTEPRAPYQGEQGQSNGSQGEGRPLVIKPRPASRRAGEPPKPIEIERTSSFLIRKKDQYDQKREGYSVETVSVTTTSQTMDIDDDESAVVWMLKKTDQSLDAIEENVPDAAKSAITFVTGNLGNTTSKVAVDAAKLAAKGGAKLLEAALPAGKWAISKGFGAVVSVAMKQQAKKSDKPQQKDDNIANLSE